ncbi:unnamed protein product [Cunninghamella echinulata]
MASIIADNLDVQHGLLQCLQKATNQFEIEAAIWASDRFCSYSTTFLSVMFTRIYVKLNDPSVSNDIQLRLIRILRHMHSDIAMARQAKQLCLMILDQQNANEEFVIVVLRTLTMLLSVALLDQQEQIDRLLSYLLHDKRISVQQSILLDLKQLSRNGITFDSSHFIALLNGITTSASTSPLLQQPSYKCAESIIKSHRTLIIHILNQSPTTSEYQTLLNILDIWKDTLSMSMQHKKYNFAIQNADLLLTVLDIFKSIKSSSVSFMTDSLADNPIDNNDQLLILISNHMDNIPMNAIYSESNHITSLAKIRKWISIKTRLLHIFDHQDDKNVFIGGLKLLKENQDDRLSSIILKYCISTSEKCNDLYTWLPSLILQTLENYIDSPIVYMNLLFLLFRTIQPNKEITDNVLVLIKKFGKWDGEIGKYATNGWNIYLIGIEASICGWYYIMQIVMSELQSLVESDSCLHWLSALSAFGSAEWTLAHDNSSIIVTKSSEIMDLYLTALTSLKAFHSVSGQAKFQTWIIRLRMEMFYSIQYTLSALKEIQLHGSQEQKCYKMMFECLSKFRTLASRYDLAAQSMHGANKDVLAILEHYKIGALVLEHATRVFINLNHGEYYFCIDPTLISLLSDHHISEPSYIPPNLSKFKNMCIENLKQIVQWEENNDQENFRQYYLDTVESFCKNMISLPLVLPRRFFKHQ